MYFLRASSQGVFASKSCPSRVCHHSPCLAVNRIKDLYKVSVRIPPDNEKSNLIRIEGDPQGVQQAKKELLELASRMVSGMGCPGGHRV